MTEQLALVDVPVSTVVRGTNGALLAAVWRLLRIEPAATVVDATYGFGRFWTDVRPDHLIAHDLDPSKGDGVDSRDLPEADGSVDVVVIDLPYVVVGGRETTTVADMHDRYGMSVSARTEAELFELHTAAMREARRVLRPGGWLLVKYADAVSSGRTVWLSDHVARVAGELGLGKFAELVHHTGPGPQPQRDRQVHPRMAHSYLGVFHR